MAKLGRLITLAVLFGLALSACKPISGSGNIKTEARSVRGITAVNLVTPGMLIIEQRGSESLTIEADDNFLPLLTNTVNNGTLTLETKPTVALKPTSLIYHLSVKDLNKIIVSGAGDVKATKLLANSFTFDVSGSGKASIDSLTTSSLTIFVSGSGELKLTGTADSQEIRIAGSGNYSGENMDSDQVKIDLSGSGRAILKVNNTLDATVSGSGSVWYIGKPTITKQISGAGSLSQR